MVEQTQTQAGVAQMEQVYNLVVELATTKAQKKASNAAFTEEIKRIEAEIKDLIEAAVEAAGEEV